MEKEADATLRGSQDFARLALNAIGGVDVWTYEAKSNRFFFDEAIARLYGLNPAAGPTGLQRGDFLANVHREDRASLQATLAKGAREAGDIGLAYRIQHAHRSVHWVLSRGHSYSGPDGKPLRRTGFGLDVTGQRQIEEQLCQSQRAEAGWPLTGGVAHDFDNLLTIIRVSIDLLRRPCTSEARRERYLEAISDTTDRTANWLSQSQPTRRDRF